MLLAGSINTWHEIGEISLNLSAVIYFVCFIPQIRLNLKRESTEGLSLLMNCILILGYLTDLLYGFGLKMPIQYRFTTITTLISLGIIHIQFARYGLRKPADRTLYKLMSLSFSVMIIFIIYDLATEAYSNRYYDIFGLFSTICWSLFLLPQIIENYSSKSTNGLSFGFVLLGAIIYLLDLTSALALGWDYPSVLTPAIGLLQIAIILGQSYYYHAMNLKIRFPLFYIHKRSSALNKEASS